MCRKKTKPQWNVVYTPFLNSRPPFPPILQDIPKTMKIDRFMSWCTASGLQSPLQIRERANTGYRYVVLGDSEAAAYYNKRNRIKLIDIPLNMCMVSPTSDGLADRLLYEKTLGTNSFFAPYLELLPSLEYYQAVLPRFWTQERWTLVNAGDQGYLSAAHALDESRLQFACDDWAQACVDSRSIYIPRTHSSDGGGSRQGSEEYSLTPLLDMINHKPLVPTNLRKTTTAMKKNIQTSNDENEDGDISEKQETERLELRISRIPNEKGTTPFTGNQRNILSSFTNLFSSKNKVSTKGSDMRVQDEEEVFISYGSFTNIETLLNYGFVAPNNPCNQEKIKVQMIRQSPVSLTFNPDGTWNDGGVGRLRRYLATPQELESYYAQEDATGVVIMNTPRRQQDSVPFLSRRNEGEVMALIGGTLEELLIDTRDAAQQATENQHDTVVSTYLQERCHTLKRAMDRIQQEFPGVFGG